MSWSVSAVGKASAVAAAVEKQFSDMAAYPCPEPEETAKQHARQALGALLAGHTSADLAVKVAASGSQNRATGQPGVCNTFNVSLDLLYGFVESVRAGNLPPEKQPHVF